MIYFSSGFCRALTACVFIFCLSACHKAEPQQDPVRAVKVTTVGSSESSMGLEFSGEIRARVESGLAFRVPGKLINRSVELGQRVRAARTGAH